MSPYPDWPDENSDEAKCCGQGDTPGDYCHDVTVKPNTGRAASLSADGEKREERRKKEELLLK